MPNGTLVTTQPNSLTSDPSSSLPGWLPPSPPHLPKKHLGHPALKRQDRLGKEPFAGFGTVVEDITESGYTKNQPILLGFF